MSGYSKILWPLTVPSGDWDFGLTIAGGAHVATVSAGPQTSILGLCSALDTALDAQGAPHGVAFTVTCSSIGTVAIAGTGAWTVDWATTDNAFSTMLGFAETEAVDGSNVLTATLQHQHGYYPGLISYGRSTSRGAGLTAPFIWKPTWPVIRTHAGSGVQRVVGPVTPSEEVELALSLIRWTEYANTTTGVRAWLDDCVTEQFRVYLDRYHGTVTTPGTVGTDYYLCSFNSDMRVRNGPHPDFLTLSVELHRESSP